MVLFSTQVVVEAQDIHYTQFHNAPFNISPGLTGIFSGDFRVMANYREQWDGVAPFTTATVATDFKIRKPSYQQGFFSVGLGVNWDEAGLTNLTHVNAFVPVSYTRRLTSRFFATVGFALSGHQRRFSLAGVTFDSQYQDGTFDPNNPTGEVVEGIRNEYLDFSMGINFRIQSLASNNLDYPVQNRSKLDFGIGFFNLRQPNQSFIPGAEDRLPLRLSPYAFGTLMVGPKVDIIGRLSGQIQDQYLEALGGVGVQYFLNTKPGQEISVTAGMQIRFQDLSDSWAPMLEFRYQAWNLGLSWDRTVSAFGVAVGDQWQPELSLRYIFNTKPGLDPEDCRLL